jgi:hypothetical protein
MKPAVQGSRPVRIPPLRKGSPPCGNSNAIGPIRQLVRGEDKVQRRYLVIAPGTVGNLGAPVQVQAE